MNQTNETQTKCLIEYMEKNGYQYEDEYDMSTIYFSKDFGNELWYFALTEPHDGNENRWMLRAENCETFDKWSNAGYQEYYNTIEDFMNYALIDIEKII